MKKHIRVVQIILFQCVNTLASSGNMDVIQVLIIPPYTSQWALIKSVFVRVKLAISRQLLSYMFNGSLHRYAPTSCAAIE